MRQLIQKGFTLIELMIVVAIIGILASLATFAYADYQVRAQLAESVSLVGPARNAVEEFYNERGRFPASNESAGLEDPQGYAGSYTESIEVRDNGTIRALIGNDANTRVAGGYMVFSASTASSGLTWQCVGQGDVPTRLLPSGCRGE